MAYLFSQAIEQGKGPIQSSGLEQGRASKGIHPYAVEQDLVCWNWPGERGPVVLEVAHKLSSCSMCHPA